LLFGQQLVRIYPYADGQQLRWLSQADQLPRDMPHDKWLFITKSLDYVGELAWQKDYAQLSIVLQKIRAYQQQEAGDVLPDACTFRAEKLYNRIGSTRPVAIMLIVTGLLSFFIYLSVWLRRHDAPPVWLRVVLTLILSIAVVYLLLVIILRGYVGGHLPLTNGYETMQFMALCILLFTLLARRFTLPFGLLLSGLAMLVSMMGEKHPPITSLTPVLSSPLLCLHVCTVMAAYALLSFTMLNGITALVLFRHAELQKKLAYVSRLLLYPAVFLLTTGIFLGAIWANQSWGRYWGWDQKEVWALITMLVYSVAFHRDSLRWLNKPLCFHLYLVMSFLTLLMTYFGVNFFLGGMHAYA
jgi:ABC-type transport system involved in cytochrome c biogenesis permease subunit